MAEMEHTRFRSFAERYIIERASKFEGNEAAIAKQAWEAGMTARTIYKQIKQLSVSIEREENEANQTSSGPSAPSGATGAYAGPPHYPSHPPMNKVIERIRDLVARGDVAAAENLAKHFGVHPSHANPRAMLPLLPPNSTPAGIAAMADGRKKYMDAMKPTVDRAVSRMKGAIKW